MSAKAPGDDPERVRRFRDAALPYLDDVYTLARFLLRDAGDAEDAVQECYLRALKHFDSFHGPAIKPWLFSILRNVCFAEFARRAQAPLTGLDSNEDAGKPADHLWQETQDSPEVAVLRRRDAEAIRGLVDALDEPFRETIVLREIEDLSYRDIAGIVGVPVGTVMSRLARARALLRAAWIAGQEHDK